MSRKEFVNGILDQDEIQDDVDELQPKLNAKILFSFLLNTKFTSFELLLN